MKTSVTRWSRWPFLGACNYTPSPVRKALIMSALENESYTVSLTKHCSMKLVKGNLPRPRLLILLVGEVAEHVGALVLHSYSSCNYLTTQCDVNSSVETHNEK
jgi:hypothetical protein